MERNDYMEQKDIIHIFEYEVGRLLTPIELEIISDWKKDGFDEPTIFEALKQSVFNGATSLRYISKILKSWKDDNQETSTEEDYSWLD